MWQRVLGKATAADSAPAPSSASSASKRKESTRRSDSGPTGAASSHRRKSSRGDDRDDGLDDDDKNNNGHDADGTRSRGFEPSSTSYSTTSQSTRRGAAAPSVASSYVTAQPGTYEKRDRERDRERDRGYSEAAAAPPPELVRNPSLAGGPDGPGGTMPKSRSGRSERDAAESRNGEDGKERKGERRRRDRSSSRDRKGHRRDRSRSEERSGKRSAKDKPKRRNTDGGVSPDRREPIAPSRARSGDLARPRGPSDGAASPRLSSHVPDMFPGQFPTGTAAPYRPPLASGEGGPGLAADYYGDTGESVAQQPGVRPQAPDLIVGAEPHLMAASTVAAPPAEPSASGGVGAANTFFASSHTFQTPEGSPGVSPKVSPRVSPSQSPARPPHGYGGQPAPTFVGQGGGGGSAARPSVASTAISPGTSSFHVPSAGSIGAAAAAGAAVGAAADYYAGGHASSQSQQSTTYHTTYSGSGPPPQGSNRPPSGSYDSSRPPPSSYGVGPPPSSSYGPSSGPPRPDKPSHSSSGIPLAAAAVGAAGLAAAAHHSHSHSHHNGSHGHVSSGAGGAATGTAFAAPPTGHQHPQHTRRRSGPLGAVVDFFRDPAGVGRFEEYTEYIGVCRHCFAPGSSARDAPRKHHYGRGLRHRPSSGRIEKRYRRGSASSSSSSSSSSDAGGGDRGGAKGWLGGALGGTLAGVGLAKVGKSLFGDARDFDDTYSVRTGQPGGASASNLPHERRQHAGSPTRRGHTVRSSSDARRDGYTYGVGETHRERKAVRKESLGVGDAAVGAALGAVTGAAVAKRRHSPHRAGAVVERRHSPHRTHAIVERRHSPHRVGAVVERRHSPHRTEAVVVRRERRGSRSSSSSSASGHCRRRRSREDSRQNQGIFGGFFASPPPRERHGTKKRKEKSGGGGGFFNFGNGSWSSSDGALVFSSSGAERKRRKADHGRINSTKDANAALIGLGATAAALAAAESSRKKHRSGGGNAKLGADRDGRHHRHASRERRHHHRRGSSSSRPHDDDGWESASDGDSVDSALVFGSAAPSSRSSSSPASHRRRRHRPSADRRDSSSRLGKGAALAAGAAAGAAGAAYLARDREDRSGSIAQPPSSAALPPMRHVHPTATDDPATFDVRPASEVSGGPPPVLTARPAPVPLQQPQPVTPVAAAVYAAHSPPSTRPPPLVGAATRDDTPDKWYRSEKKDRRTDDGVQFDFTPEQAAPHKREDRHEDRREQRRRRERDVVIEVDDPREVGAKVGPAEPVVVAAAAAKERRSGAADSSGDERAVRRAEFERELARVAQLEKPAGRPRYHTDDVTVIEPAVSSGPRTKDRGRRYEQRRDSEPREEKVTKQEESKSSKALAGIVGAAMGATAAAVVADEVRSLKDQDRDNERSEARREKERDRPAEVSRERRLAQQAAAKVRRAPSPVVHEDYGAYFAPTDLISRPAVGKERAAPDPLGGIEGVTVRSPSPPAGGDRRRRGADVRAAFQPFASTFDYAPLAAHEQGGLDLPWSVPVLQLLVPTPAGSRMGSYFSSPVVQPADKGAPIEEIPDDTPIVEEAVDGKRATPIVGEAKHRTQETPIVEEVREAGVETPIVTEVRESKKEAPAGKDIGEPSSQEPTADRPRKASRVSFGGSQTHEYETVTPHDSREDLRKQPEPRAREASGFADAAAAGAIGAAAVAAAAGATSSGPDEEPPPSARSAASQSSVEEIPRTHIPGAFDEDPELLASMAAGLQESGLPPELVTEDPRYFRRDSPPGSEDGGRGAFYQQPFAETVSDVGFGPRWDAPPPPQRGFVEGEVPDTPREERRADVAGDEPHDIAVKAEKKSKKKSKRQGPDEFDVGGGTDDFEPGIRRAYTRDANAELDIIRAASRADDSPILEDLDEDKELPPNSSQDMDRVQPSFVEEPRRERELPTLDSPAPIPKGDAELKKAKQVDEEDDDVYESPREYAPSVASAPVGRSDSSSSKKKKKSKRKSTGHDDEVSVVSAPVEDSSTKGKKEKKGGILGLFSKTSNDVPDKNRSRSAVEEDDEEEGRRKHRKHRRSRDEDDLYSQPAESTIDLSQPIDTDGKKSKKSKDKKKRSSRHESDELGESGRRAQDWSEKVSRPRSTDIPNPPVLPPRLIMKQGDSTQRSRTVSNGDDLESESFLGERPEPTEPPDIRGIEDEGGGGLGILTPSRNSAPVTGTIPATPFRASQSKDDAFIPSPTQDLSVAPPGIDRRRSMIQTDFASSAPLGSPTAVPLVFRKPPSAGLTRSASETPTTSPSQATPRPRRPRPLSKEFKSSEGFRPLFLVEQHKPKQEVDQDEVLPSLPSSHSTSRASSVHEGGGPDDDEGILSQPLAATRRRGFQGQPLDIAAAQQPPDLLDSAQATPTAESYQATREQNLLDQARQEVIQREIEWTERQSSEARKRDSAEKAAPPKTGSAIKEGVSEAESSRELSGPGPAPESVPMSQVAGPALVAAGVLGAAGLVASREIGTMDEAQAAPLQVDREFQVAEPREATEANVPTPENEFPSSPAGSPRTVAMEATPHLVEAAPAEPAVAPEPHFLPESTPLPPSEPASPNVMDKAVNPEVELPSIDFGPLPTNIETREAIEVLENKEHARFNTSEETVPTVGEVAQSAVPELSKTLATDTAPQGEDQESNRITASDTRSYNAGRDVLEASPEEQMAPPAQIGLPATEDTVFRHGEFDEQVPVLEKVATDARALLQQEDVAEEGEAFVDEPLREPLTLPSDTMIHHGSADETVIVPQEVARDAVDMLQQDDRVEEGKAVSQSMESMPVTADKTLTREAEELHLQPDAAPRDAPDQDDFPAVSQTPSQVTERDDFVRVEERRPSSDSQPVIGHTPFARPASSQHDQPDARPELDSETNTELEGRQAAPPDNSSSARQEGPEVPAELSKNLAQSEDPLSETDGLGLVAGAAATAAAVGVSRKQSKKQKRKARGAQLTEVDNEPRDAEGVAAPAGGIAVTDVEQEREAEPALPPPSRKLSKKEKRKAKVGQFERFDTESASLEEMTQETPSESISEHGLEAPSATIVESQPAYIPEPTQGPVQPAEDNLDGREAENSLEPLTRKLSKKEKRKAKVARQLGGELEQDEQSEEHTPAETPALVEDTSAEHGEVPSSGPIETIRTQDTIGELGKEDSAPVSGLEKAIDDVQVPTGAPEDIVTLDNDLTHLVPGPVESLVEPQAPVFQPSAAQDTEPLSRLDDKKEAEQAISMDSEEAVDQPRQTDSVGTTPIVDDVARDVQLDSDAKEATIETPEPPTDDFAPQPLIRKQSKKDKKKSKAARLTDSAEEVATSAVATGLAATGLHQSETPTALTAEPGDVGDGMPRAMDQELQPPPDSDITQPLSRKQSKKEKKKAKAERLTKLQDEIEPADESAKASQPESALGSDPAKEAEDIATADAGIEVIEAPSNSENAAEEALPSLERKHSDQEIKDTGLAAQTQQDNRTQSALMEAEATSGQLPRDIDVARESDEAPTGEPLPSEPQETTEDTFKPVSRKQSKKDKKKAAKAGRLASHADDGEAVESLQPGVDQNEGDRSATNALAKSLVAEGAETLAEPAMSNTRDLGDEAALEPLSRKQSKKEKKKAKKSRSTWSKEDPQPAEAAIARGIKENLTQEAPIVRGAEKVQPQEATTGEPYERPVEEPVEEPVEQHDDNLAKGFDAEPPHGIAQAPIENSLQALAVAKSFNDEPGRNLDPPSAANDASGLDLAHEAEEMTLPAGSGAEGLDVQPAPESVLESSVGQQQEPIVGTQEVSVSPAEDPDGIVEPTQAPLPPSPEGIAAIPDDVKVPIQPFINEPIEPVSPEHARTSERQDDVSASELGSRQLQGVGAAGPYAGETSVPGHWPAPYDEDLDNFSLNIATTNARADMEERMNTDEDFPRQEVPHEGVTKLLEGEIAHGPDAARIEDPAISQPDTGAEEQASMEPDTVRKEPMPVLDNATEPMLDNFSIERAPSPSDAQPSQTGFQKLDDAEEAKPVPASDQTESRKPDLTGSDSAKQLDREEGVEPTDLPKLGDEEDTRVDQHPKEYVEQKTGQTSPDRHSTERFEGALGPAIAGAVASTALAAYASGAGTSESDAAGPTDLGKDEATDFSIKQTEEAIESTSEGAEKPTQQEPETLVQVAADTPAEPVRAAPDEIVFPQDSQPPQTPPQDDLELAPGKKSKKDKKKKGKQVLNLSTEEAKPAALSESQEPVSITEASEPLGVQADSGANDNVVLGLQDATEADFEPATSKKSKKDKKKKGKQVFDVPTDITEPISQAERAAVGDSDQTAQPLEGTREQEAEEPSFIEPPEAPMAEAEPAAGKKGKKEKKKKKGKQVFSLPAEVEQSASRAESVDPDISQETSQFSEPALEEVSREAVAEQQELDELAIESAAGKKGKKKKKGKEVFTLPTEPVDEPSEAFLQPETQPVLEIEPTDAGTADGTSQNQVDSAEPATVQNKELQLGDEEDFALAAGKKGKKGKKKNKTKEVFDLAETPTQLEPSTTTDNSASPVDAAQHERDLDESVRDERRQLPEKLRDAEHEEFEPSSSQKHASDVPEESFEPTTSLAADIAPFVERDAPREPLLSPSAGPAKGDPPTATPWEAGEDDFDEAAGGKGKKGKKKRSKKGQVFSLLEEQPPSPAEPAEPDAVESHGLLDQTMPVDKDAQVEEAIVAKPQVFETTSESLQREPPEELRRAAPLSERKRPHSPSPVRERQSKGDSSKGLLNIESVEEDRGQEADPAAGNADGSIEAETAPLSRKASKKAKKKKAKQSSDWPDQSPEDVSRSLSLKGTARTAGTVGAGVAIFEGMQRAASLSEQHERELQRAGHAHDVSAERHDSEAGPALVQEPDAMDVDVHERGRSFSPRQQDMGLRDSALQMLDTPMPDEPLAAQRLVRDSGYQGADDSPTFGEETPARKTRHDDSEDTNRRSLEHPLHVSVEASPEYDISISGPRDAHLERVRSDSASLPSQVVHRAEDYPSPAKSQLDREPSPVDSMTKDRSAVLFDSSPSIRDAPKYNRGPDVPATPSSLRQDSEEPQDDAFRAPGDSLFGGPVGIDSEREATRSPHTPMPFGSSGPHLATITEQSPDDSPLRQKSRGAIAGSLDQNDGRRRSRLGARSPNSGRQVTTDDLISRLSWPDVDEENHSVDLERSRSRNTDKERRLSGQRKKPPLATDAGKHEGERRSISGASVRSQDSINAIIRSPPTSAVDTPSPQLRHTDRSVSSDLRAAARQSETGSAVGSETKRSDDAKPRKASFLDKGDRPDLDRGLGAAAVAAATAAGVGVASSSTYDPVTDKGKGPITKMTDVYEGWGDDTGSPRSPTRPPSMRRRQSMQILDLETRLNQLVSENRLLSDAKSRAERQLDEAAHDHEQQSHALNEAVQTRDLYLKQKDEELEELRGSLQNLQTELSHLSEINRTLGGEDEGGVGYAQRYRELEEEHSNSRRQWEDDARELEELRTKHNSLSGGMEAIVANEVRVALQGKDAELEQLRDELAQAQAQVRALQQQIVASRAAEGGGGDDGGPVEREPAYFLQRCQKLCGELQLWVLRFSKFSDHRACRRLDALGDGAAYDRFDGALLDGSDADAYLGDRVARRDLFMSVAMAMVWEYVFTRYLFGMDREQRQKLKALEKTVAEVGPPATVGRWRATTLALLSRREAFARQREQDTAAVVDEILRTLSAVLPPPAAQEAPLRAGLHRVLAGAAELSVAMRTQRAEYIMLPPLQPEYTAEGDLARTVAFNAELMNERSGRTASNEALEARGAVVRVVLFPLVVRQGASGDAADRSVVCPAQVLVARDDDGGGPPPAAAARERQGSRAVSAMGNPSVGSLAQVEGGMI